ncbi:hypothetical protein BHM03_00046082 [Ensete ventricosum]|nr:hypothetical protein BHM03_00046082 [Ensete ventricosum]
MLSQTSSRAAVLSQLNLVPEQQCSASPAPEQQSSASSVQFPSNNARPVQLPINSARPTQFSFQAAMLDYSSSRAVLGQLSSVPEVVMLGQSSSRAVVLSQLIVLGQLSSIPEQQCLASPAPEQQSSASSVHLDPRLSISTNHVDFRSTNSHLRLFNGTLYDPKDGPQIRASNRKDPFPCPSLRNPGKGLPRACGGVGGVGGEMIGQIVGLPSSPRLMTVQQSMTASRSDVVPTGADPSQGGRAMTWPPRQRKLR